jgi:hypothetical protein
MGMEKIQSVLKKGIWLYDNAVSKKVTIIKQNWDYYYEDGYTEGIPHLNADGFTFYVVFDEPLVDGSYVFRSETLYSLNEAIKYAESKINGPIYWD